MITLKEWMEAIGYRITEGDTYGWQCYGNNAYSISAWNGVHGRGGWSANVVFDTRDQTVFEADVCDYTNERAYRLINPDYRKDYDAEAKDRDSLANQAWDDVDFTDLETDDDWIQKALAIVAGEVDYDTRVSVPLDLPKDELFEIMRLAHERDMTLNEYVEEALRCAIEEYERDPEGMAARWKAYAKEKTAV